jgi:ribosomal protein L32
VAQLGLRVVRAVSELRILAVICTCRHGRAQHVGRDAICKLCDCPHFTPAGSVTPTASRESRNASPPVEATHSESAEPARRCSKCHEDKPLEEFHRDARASDGRTTTCKKCVAAKPYKPTLLRVVKTRARKRALAQLARRHPDEFRLLLSEHETKAMQEAEQIAADPRARQVYSGSSEPVRLRRGRLAEGETLTDRIDVARCPQCIRYHDAGHVCANCGRSPHEREAS